MSRRSDCPISCALDLIGDKWTLVVLRDLLFFNKTKFDELLESPEKISTSVLTDRLHKLERAGLIEKTPYSTHRLRMTYSPTEKGKIAHASAQRNSPLGKAKLREHCHL